MKSAIFVVLFGTVFANGISAKAAICPDLNGKYKVVRVTDIQGNCHLSTLYEVTQKGCGYLEVWQSPGAKDLQGFTEGTAILNQGLRPLLAGDRTYIVDPELEQFETYPEALFVMREHWEYDISKKPTGIVYGEYSRPKLAPGRYGEKLSETFIQIDTQMLDQGTLTIEAARSFSNGHFCRAKLTLAK